MDYQRFVSCLVAGLQKIYGSDAVIVTGKILGNNGQHNGGLRISHSAEEKMVPVLRLDALYEKYRKGSMDMEECIRETVRLREQKGNEKMAQFAAKIGDWNFVKEKIFPILISTSENRELLQELVSVPMLDLSVAYMIRGDLLEDGGGCVKISKMLLRKYGIDQQTLHSYAMKNMRRDGYRFYDLDEMFRGLQPCRNSGEMKMYVFTNRENLYGAVGILDKGMLKDFAGERNFYILPASIHETILVPADNDENSSFLDSLVSEVNEALVEKDERLSDHSYYYDAKRNEIRLCA